MRNVVVPLFLLAASAVAAEKPPRMAPGTAETRFAVSAAAEAPAAPGSYAPLLARVTPAVVSVFPASLVHESKDGKDPLDRFFGKPGKKDDEEPDNGERIQGVGSGVILTPDGWIVTNSHVVHLANGRVADAITVELHDHRRFTARLAGFDEATDLALLKIGVSGLNALPIGDSEAIRVGDTVFAVGNPFEVGITATQGMVSAVGRSSLGMNGPGGYEDFIQTDAPINPGNSGGALVNASGQLVGINTAIYSTFGGNVGIGFAIPSHLMRYVLANLAEQGKVPRGFFGVSTGDLAVLPGGKENVFAGAKVEEVMPGGPAEKAGLKKDDIIVRANGHAVESRGDLRLAMSFVKPGEILDIELVRGGKKQSARITAADEPKAGPGATFSIAALPGVKFRQEARHLVVDSATPDAARRTSLKAAMEILEINGVAIASIGEAEAALKRGVNKLKVRDGDDEVTLVVRVE